VKELPRPPRTSRPRVVITQLGRGRWRGIAHPEEGRALKQGWKRDSAASPEAAVAQGDSIGRSVVKTWLTAGLTVLGSVLLSLCVWPFVWPFSPLAVLLGGIGVYLLWTLPASLTWSLAVRVLVLGVVYTAALLVAALAPLLSPSGVRYVIRAEKGGPFSYSRLLACSQVAGIRVDLLVVADPVRSELIRRLSGHALSTCRLLQVREVGARKYIDLPLQSAFKSRRLGVSAGEPQRERLVILVPSTYADISLETKGLHGSFEAAVGFTLSTLIDWRQQGGGVPWESVDLNGSDITAVASYVAVLDQALEIAAEGKTGDAIATLEELLPSTHSQVEQCRLLILLGGLSETLVGGNLGQLQAIAYYQVSRQHCQPLLPDSPTGSEAFSVWAAAQHSYNRLARVIPSKSEPGDQPRGAGTAIDRSHLPQPSPSSLSEFLRLSSQLARSFDEKDGWVDGISGFEEALGFASIDDFELAARELDSADPRAALLFYHFGTSRFWKEAQDDAAACRVTRALGTVARKCPDRLRIPLLRSLRYQRELRHLMAAMEEGTEPTKEEVLRFLSHRQSSFGGYSFPRHFAQLASVLSAVEKGEEPTGRETTPAPDLPWWDSRWLDWFLESLWGKLLSMEEGGFLLGTFSEKEVAFLIRDQAGKGRLFAPGLGFLASLPTEDSTNRRHRALQEELDSVCRVRSLEEVSGTFR
jgi:hypothetical protein